MSSLPLHPMPEFNPDAEVGVSLSTRWQNWIADFETFILASGITDNTRKRALLLYQAGSRVREIFKQLEGTGNNDAYDTAKAKLQEHFEPQKNRRYEVYRFRQLKQALQETLDQFHTRLRTAAQTCEFNDVDFEIEEQILIGGTSSRIRKCALRDPEYDLKAMLLDGRRDETSSYQAKEIENTAEPAHASTQQMKTTSEKQCRYCGGVFPHKTVCPAKGKECHKCGRRNHFASVCRGTPNSTKPRPYARQRNTKQSKKGTRLIRQLEDQNSATDSNDEYMYTVRPQVSKSTSPQVNVNVHEHSFKMTVDTGATINVIDSATFANMTNVVLQNTNVKAFAFNSDKPVKFLGKFEAVIATRKKYTVGTIYVTKQKDSGCLLSFKTAQELGLVQMSLDKIGLSRSSGNQSASDSRLSETLKKYDSVFCGVGKLKGHEVKLNIDSEVIPQAQALRRIPFHIREKVKCAIKDLEEQGIIEPVPDSQPTPWISPIVAVPKKDGNVRICVDMRMANRAIKRVRHLIPTVNDISFELNQAQYFTKLDLSQAYHQIPLAEESRYITTFTTHIGLYRYTRMNYGTNAAAELFQHTLQQHLQGIEGVRNIADDIIVYGKTKADHDRALENCLQRLKDKGLTLNREKCQFLQDKLSFFGQVFSKEGTRPDPSRVADLQNASVPTNSQEVRSFLGMSNYSAKYIKDYATISTPLRELTKKNVQFCWQNQHEEAFIALKTALTNAPVMAYFDKNKQTFVTVDASPVGISAILSQKAPGTEDRHVVSYASRALTDVESRYSQTEKEALSIVWAVEHYHLYLYGAEFTLITDHKPLEIIYGNPQAKTSARIERWVLRLQPYDFKVVYKSGATNAADFLSRHPTQASRRMHEKMAEEYINFITPNSVPKTMTLDEISQATDQDRELKGLRAAIRLNKWDSDIVKPYRLIKDELTIGKQNVILRGSRIIIPAVLQQKAVDVAHESHQGISKTKALLREKVWFSGIDALVKQTLASCLACQAVGRAATPEPVRLTSMPEAPWHLIHIDFVGPLSSNEYLLVAIDRYSRYPEVETVRSTKASCVIPKLDKIFAAHGLPSIIKTDNGPPFCSDEFKKYCNTLGIKHERTTPYWPQANGEVERFNQPLEKAIQTAHLEGRIWRQEINRFLLQYRTTPHSVTKVPPCELLFNRQIRGKLPSIQKKIIIDRHAEAKENEARSQIYHKQYADKRRNAKESDIAVGDRVLVKQICRNKLTPRFNHTPYIVVSRRGSRLTAKNEHGHYVTRNISHFKKFTGRTDYDDSEIEDGDITIYREEKATGAQQIDRRFSDKENEENGHELNRRPIRTKRTPERFGNAVPSDIIRMMNRGSK